MVSTTGASTDLELYFSTLVSRTYRAKCLGFHFFHGQLNSKWSYNWEPLYGYHITDYTYNSLHFQAILHVFSFSTVKNFSTFLNVKSRDESAKKQTARLECIKTFLFVQFTGKQAPSVESAPASGAKKSKKSFEYAQRLSFFVNLQRLNVFSFSNYTFAPATISFTQWAEMLG